MKKLKISYIEEPTDEEVLKYGNALDALRRRNLIWFIVGVQYLYLNKSLSFYLTLFFNIINLVILICNFILLSCMNNAQQESQNKNEELQKTTSTKATDVSYKPLNNYFVKNTVTELKENRFDSEEKFSEVFGVAPLKQR